MDLAVTTQGELDALLGDPRTDECRILLAPGVYVLGADRTNLGQRRIVGDAPMG